MTSLLFLGTEVAKHLHIMSKKNSVVNLKNKKINKYLIRGDGQEDYSAFFLYRLC
jgi:hypothetical protein